MLVGLGCFHAFTTAWTNPLLMMVFGDFDGLGHPFDHLPVAGDRI
jgi:hypothetical protein